MLLSTCCTRMCSCFVFQFTLYWSSYYSGLRALSEGWVHRHHYYGHALNVQSKDKESACKEYSKTSFQELTSKGLNLSWRPMPEKWPLWTEAQHSWAEEAQIVHGTKVRAHAVQKEGPRLEFCLDFTIKPLSFGNYESHFPGQKSDWILQLPTSRTLVTVGSFPACQILSQCLLWTMESVTSLYHTEQIKQSHDVLSKI